MVNLSSDHLSYIHQFEQCRGEQIQLIELHLLAVASLSRKAHTSMLGATTVANVS